MRLAGRKIHMIGIGGTGMSSAARLLLERGCSVYGSDSTASEVTKELATMGARVSIGHDPENIPAGCDMVVTTAAAQKDNPELIEAVKRGIHVIKYARLVGLLMRGKLGIGVAGTHGKTTTSSMLVEILRAGKLSPSYVIGGKIVGHAGNECAGDGEFFVAEACEYDRSFLSLCPRYAILTNLEPDHLDYYGNEKNLIQAFRVFVSSLPSHGVLLACGDSLLAKEVGKSAKCYFETYGFNWSSDWRVKIINVTELGHKFLINHGRNTYEFELNVPGIHNVLNAASAAGLALSLGVPEEMVASGIKDFRGTQRRFQLLTEKLPITVIDDYAHHPTEIAAVLRTARERFPGRKIWAIFQAHQHSRTRAFFEDFTRSLALADRVTIAKIFSVRETEIDRKSINGSDLAGRLYQLSVDSEYVPDFRSIEYLLHRETQKGDVVIVMGAGDIFKVAHSFSRTIRERHVSEIPVVKTFV